MIDHCSYTHNLSSSEFFQTLISQLNFNCDDDDDDYDAWSLTHLNCSALAPGSILNTWKCHLK